ncbi:T9SS type B sorting domain-containing protein [Algibacter sp. L4_22]|uniref:T9SS type B sorting domain-containing protein n=1 Tax=Algibacter sp. L4_22 TaxID=2942477 RepID=UPI00201B49B9|nr:T9SS type B sorting domain-containing protein [Algibacter sp. L4_22]MCL5127071.1 T9SS type B sorting domain-containing protein [Algibacter sp. L4_22]
MGFCSGNSGDPIFTETFGVGTNNVPLPAGTTTYSFASVKPFDGFYTISNRTNWFGWHDIPDHTAGDTNGRSLVVNADYTSGEFYRTAISGLCENTTYEFSSWMVNLLPANHSCGIGIPINVKFEIWDNTDTQLLASGNTGDIYGTSSADWRQYALVFQSEPGQTSIILKMLNNGIGGCGNDLAIDDIVFKTCGDTVIIEDVLNEIHIDVCEDNLPFSTELTVTPDFVIFSSHFYQWQESNDGVNWIDIIGENAEKYTTPPLNNTTFYRVKVAEDVVNLTNNSCNSTSDIFEVRVIPQPNAPASNGDVLVCENDTTPLSVTVPSGVVVNWYSAAIGGTLLQANSTTYNATTNGLYYAEAETVNGNCISNTRTEVSITFFEIPEVEDETLEFCENESIELHADTNIFTATYLWSTGETTEVINVDQAGIYTVEVANESCAVTKIITLSQIDLPIIASVESVGKSIVITTENKGDFLYSITGNIFQPNNIFTNIEGGNYTIYMKQQNCDEIVSMQFIHFFIPKFFTPNGDGANDSFALKGIEYYQSTQVSIFNRYGKLLKFSENAPFLWDGLFAGELLETDDYWYVIIINGQQFTGHFTLKR